MMMMSLSTGKTAFTIFTNSLHSHDQTGDKSSSHKIQTFFGFFCKGPSLSPLVLLKALTADTFEIPLCKGIAFKF